MRSRLSRILLAVGVVVIVFAAYELRPLLLRQYLSVVLKREIPVGSTREHAQSVLTRRGIENGFDDVNRAVVGIIRDVRQGFLLIEDIQIRIPVDEEERVTAVIVEPAYTGL